MKIWNFSTTIRNSDRLLNFLQIANEFNNFPWNHQTQILFFARLIESNAYNPISFTPSTNRNELIHQINSFYTDPPMRGRTAMNPLSKLGLVTTDTHTVLITNFGASILNNAFNISQILHFASCNYTFTDSNSNIRPYIATILFLQNLNGPISHFEFSRFVMTINISTDLIQNLDALRMFRLTNDYNIIHAIENRCLNNNNFDEYLNNNLHYFKNCFIFSVTNSHIALNNHYSQEIERTLSTNSLTAY